MKKTVLLGALLWAMLALPGAAFTVNMSSSFVPEFGQFEVLEYLSYSPYELKVINGETFLANPDESPGYHYAEAWTSFEVGLGQGLSTTLIVPYDLWRQFDGQDGSIGFYDLTWALSRKIWDSEANAGRVRLRVDLATGNAERGLGAGVPGLGFEHASDYKLTPQLSAYLNLNYFYRLRRTMVDEEGLIGTSWSGQRFQINTALEWTLNDSWSVILEQMATWQEGAQENRQAVSESGSTLVQLAPGVTWTLSPKLALQASVMIPVLRQGYQDAYRWTAVFGTVLDF
ncbi:hypothetical protein D3C87_923300 [compost metagenome]